MPFVSQKYGFEIQPRSVEYLSAKCDGTLDEVVCFKFARAEFSHVPWMAPLARANRPSFRVSQVKCQNVNIRPLLKYRRDFLQFKWRVKKDVVIEGDNNLGLGMNDAFI